MEFGKNILERNGIIDMADIIVLLVIV